MNGLNNGLLFQLSCLAVAASSAAVVFFGLGGLFVSLAFFVVCLFLAFSFDESERQIAFLYSFFFLVLAGLFSCAFLGFLDLFLAFPLAIFAVVGFFFLLKFFFLSDKIQAVVLECFKGFARVDVKWSIASSVKPGVYLVKCAKRRRGLVTVLVEKGLFSDKPSSVLDEAL